MLYRSKVTFTAGFTGLAIVLCLGAATAARADSLYVGAGAYFTDVEITVGGEDDITPAGFIGYQFLDSNVLMLSAEVGYYDLGSWSGDLDEVSYSVDASALTFAGVAYVPVGPFFEIYAKAGLAAVEVETRFADMPRTDDDTETFIGAGVALDFFDTIDIYAEYLQFDNQIDSQMVGVGIRFDFF
ncbi:outer membrane beta-barrel protein [Congregibacter variabilis]|uniref:Outer membrane beta-barrel protein n=1 Tax=Congregibacter variabilis TaxID=3081200 RepID=A0ABZ0I130_9GAMM|nr:outer membrane beta-barrel protein [Congregibacter sp. IMCC43200]